MHNRSSIPATLTALVGIGLACGLACDSPSDDEGWNGPSVSLDDLQLGPTDFKRYRAREEEELRVQLGSTFEPERLAARLDRNALRVMEDAAILSLYARNHGLVVTDDALQANLERDPAFQNDNGDFEIRRLVRVADELYGSEHALRESRRDDLLRFEAMHRLLDSITVSAEDVNRLALEQLETIEIVYLVLDERIVPPEFEIHSSDVVKLLREEEPLLRKIYQEQHERSELPNRATSQAGEASYVVPHQEAENSSSFEDVRRMIAREVLRTSASKKFAQENVRAVEVAIRGGDSLESATRRFGLTVQRTPRFARTRNGYVPGLGIAPEVRDQAFALSVRQPTRPSPIVMDTRSIFVQLVARHAPEEADLADRATQLRPRLLLDKQAREIQSWLDARREQFRKEGRLRVNSSATHRP
jgi:hypothetical protein